MLEPPQSGKLEERLRREAREHLRKVQEEGRRNIRAMLDGQTARDREALLAHLRSQLRKERKKARIRHAGYDFNRHLALHILLASIRGEGCEGRSGS